MEAGARREELGANKITLHPDSGFRLLATGYRLPATGYRRRARGCMLGESGGKGFLGVRVT
jgi:hypothetical protein